MKTPKIISLLLILSFFSSLSIFVITPSKAEATLSVTDVSALPLNILNTAQTVIGVTEGIVTSAQSTISAVQDVLGVVKEYGLDTAGFIVAKTLLNQVTSEFLNYVNTGSDGGALYVENLRSYIDGFQAATANGLIGETLSRLDFDGSEDLIATLQQEYTFEESPEENLSRLLSVKFQYGEELIDGEDSTSGSFGCEVGEGLSGWAKLRFKSQNAQCTEQGAYLVSRTYLDREVKRKKEEEQAKLIWSGGIKSPTDENGNIITPGVTIKDQLSSLIGSGQNQLEEADELNEVVGALVGKLTSQISGGRGLKGVDTDAIRDDNLDDLTEDTSGTITYVPQDRDPDQSVRNLAPNRKEFAEQSSQRGDFRPENAADGFTGGNVDSGSGSVAETTRDGELHPWWQIDLGKKESILFIKIFRRISDENNESAVGSINVYISDTPFGNTRGTLASSETRFATRTMPEEGSLLINVNKLGRYIRVQRTESSRTHLSLAEVQIIQNPPPVLTLNGSTKVTFAATTVPFIDPGATAEDEQDGDMTSRIVATGQVNSAVAGTYTIKYSVEDLGGAKSEKTRTIIVTKSSDDLN